MMNDDDDDDNLDLGCDLKVVYISDLALMFSWISYSCI